VSWPWLRLGVPFYSYWFLLKLPAERLVPERLFQGLQRGVLPPVEELATID